MPKKYSFDNSAFENGVNNNKGVSYTSDKATVYEIDEKRLPQEESQEEIVPEVTYFGLFRYATSFDYMLMFFGVIAAVGHGCAIQINFLVLSRLMDFFIADLQNTTTINNSSSNSTSGENLQSVISEVVIEFCAVALAVLLLGYTHMMCWNLTSERQSKIIRGKAFHSVLKQNMGWFDKHQSGELNSRLTGDISAIQAGIGDKLATFLQWTSTFVGGAVICLIRGWKLTLVMLTISPLAIIVGGLVARSLQTFTRLELDAYAAAGGIAEEVLSSIRTVAAFGGEDNEAKRYNKNLKIARKVGIKRGLVSGGGQGCLWTIVFGILSFAFWYGAKLIREEDHYTVGILLQVQFSIFTGTRALGQAVANIENFSAAKGAAAIIFYIIERVPSIDSSSDKGKKPSATNGAFEFKNINFAYPARPDLKILSGLDFSVKTGQTVALVGPSGCGKSTAVQLLQRFYDPTIGEILLDSENIKNLNIKWLRQQIGVVSQEPILFATTIAENIKFGQDGATEADVIKAAKEANAHNFISKLPLGYNTEVGERGTQLSGGQKQRIAIARALIRNPKILLLDDATSALDYESEAVVQEALDKARMGRTTLIIAHRLSTIRNADLICVLDHGVIKERGTHDELVEKQGLYHKLVFKQTDSDDEEEDDEELEMIEVPSSPPSYNGLTSAMDSKHSPIPLTPILQRKRTDTTGSTTSLAKRKRTMTSEKLPLQAINKRKRTLTSNSLAIKENEEIKLPEEDDSELPAPSIGRMFKLNSNEWWLILFGALSAFTQGAIFPALAVLFSEILGAFGLSDPAEQSRQINSFVGVMVIIGFGAGLFTLFMVAMFTASGEKLTLRLRDMAFKKMLRQEVGWFDDQKNQVGTLTARLATDASMVKGATGSHLSTLINASSTAGLSILVAFLFGWKLALVVCCFLPPLIAMGILQTKILVGFAKGSKNAMEEGGKLVSEAIDNIRTVAALTKEDYFENNFNRHYGVMYQEGKKKSQVFGVIWGLSQSIVFFTYAANFGFGAYLVTTKEMEFKNVFRIFIAIAAGAIELGRINAFAPDYSKAKVSAARLFALFDRVSAIDPKDESGDKPATCKGQVTFQGVKFRYPHRPQVQVLQGLDLHVEPGQTLALVGSSGCGKSTTVQLLERFYDPEFGKVLVDGVDITKLNIEWLRSQISIVAQEPILFEATIKENITYGKQNREITMQEIIEAAKNANIHTFIESLPLGYDTMVGAQGAQLVGGQKQRIAIARALIRNPKILLLDEATSALDTENEQIVQEALEKAQEGRTSIVIAHRLSTIENADKIAVIDSGRVVEQGTHHELMKLEGLYYKLQQIQMGNAAPDKTK